VLWHPEQWLATPCQAENPVRLLHRDRAGLHSLHDLSLVTKKASVFFAADLPIIQPDFGIAAICENWFATKERA
jgi:hypothetical protein